MKAYKKKGIAMLLAMSVCPVSAFAAEPSVQISSGLDLEADAAESTFDDSRIVYGEAAPDTEITFTVSRVNHWGEAVEIYEDTLTVGSMGLFSTTLPLEKGNNYITLTAVENGEETMQEEVVIKRVSKAVKQQLQRMIALPGLHTNLR